MKLQELKEQIVWEDEDIAITLTERQDSLQLAIKGKPGQFIKDVEQLAKKGLNNAGILGSYALEQIKRQKGIRGHRRRTMSFYARNTQERKAYEKLIKQLTKSGSFKLVRTFPFGGGGRSWELKPK